jgi:membrane-associated protease RseP (regulator of RpoE activity)
VDPAPYDDQAVQPSEWPWQPHKKFQDRVWRHAILFIVTIFTAAYAGVSFYASFVTDLGTKPLNEPGPALMAHGLWYGLTALAILGCHEMGHYLACRYYDVDASLPFFLPSPALFGTFGAFIRIREPIHSKPVFFDIGIAGPLAGFLVAVPALVIGIAMSRIIPMPPPEQMSGGINFAEPLLQRLATWMWWGTVPEGYTLNLHPIGFGAWFGLLATALNLFPIGQLDGGHISYAVLGRRSSHLTLAMIGVAIVLCWVSLNWILWTVLLVVMLRIFGRHHPVTPDVDQPLDRPRIALALFSLVILILCFTPAPISPIEFIKP